jgi:hypothetical protein
MFSNRQCISLRSSSDSGTGTTFLLVGEFDLASGSENIHRSVHWRTQDFSLGGGVADPEDIYIYIYIYI